MREGRIQGQLEGDDATEESVMHLADADRPTASGTGCVKKLWQVRELSTVAILVFEILFFTWYLWPDGNRAHPFLNARQRAPDPEVLGDLRHRRGRRRDRDHLRRRGSLAGRRHGPRGGRRRATVHRPGLVAGSGDDRRRPRRAGRGTPQRRARRTRQAAAVHRHARRDGHFARPGVHHHRGAVFRRLDHAARRLASARPAGRLGCAAHHDRPGPRLPGPDDDVPVGAFRLCGRRQRNGGAVYRHPVAV